MPITLETLRRYAVARTLFAPTLPKAITQFDSRAAKSNRRGTVLCAGARRGSPTGGGRALCSRQFTQMVWRRDAFHRAKERLAHAQVDGQTYYWPATENPASRRRAPDEVVRLLAPFDPLVWDRRRFEHLWGWAYRFEAYTPAPKRVRGNYALPLLWGEQVIGWGNVSMVGGRMQAGLGYVAGKPPSGAAFSAALDEELQRMETFLQAGASEKGEPLANNSDGET